MRKILKLMCAQCLTLDMSLENVLVASESGREIRTRINDQAAVRTEENYLEMEKKLNQVIQMNQRWQSYNQNREQQVHGLLARIVELEQLNQEGENLKSMMQAKEVDNLNLRKEIDNLTKEK
uniref:TSG101 and ALIX binding domain-containing protein n=1 Tax=Arion vulgaris TaxID=1028688 RepID=A0A0B7A9A9_9EUPU